MRRYERLIHENIIGLEPIAKVFFGSVLFVRISRKFSFCGLLGTCPPVLGPFGLLFVNLMHGKDGLLYFGASFRRFGSLGD